MKKLDRSAYVLLVILCCITIEAHAQKGGNYSQYMVNNLLINPAVAGIENYIDAKSAIRKQWVGIENSPLSMYVSANASIGYNDRNAASSSLSKDPVYTPNRVERNNKFHLVNPHHGVGIIMQAEKMGLLQAQAVSLVYAYHLPLTRTINFSIGASGGITRRSFNSARAQVNDQMDPSLSGENQNSFKTDLSIGGWFYTKRGYVGLTGAHLLKSSDDYQEPFMSGLSISLSPVYMATAGYRINLGTELAVIPSVLVRKMVAGPWMVDVNAKVEYDQTVWAGISYRDQNAISLMGGVHINQLLSAGYAYDWTTSDLSSANAGSHEIFLGVRLKNKAQVTCPQWVW